MKILYVYWLKIKRTLRYKLTTKEWAISIGYDGD